MNPSTDIYPQYLENLHPQEVNNMPSSQSNGVVSPGLKLRFLLVQASVLFCLVWFCFHSPNGLKHSSFSPPPSNIFSPIQSHTKSQYRNQLKIRAQGCKEDSGLELYSLIPLTTLCIDLGPCHRTQLAVYTEHVEAHGTKAYYLSKRRELNPTVTICLLVARGCA